MSKTTTITVPAPVQVEFDKQGAPNETDTIEYTFYRNFLSRIVLIDPSFGKDALSVIAAMEIRGKFKDAKPGDKVVLPYEQYKRLKDTVEKPQNPYNPYVMVQCTSFLLAVMDPESTSGTEEEH